MFENGVYPPVLTKNQWRSRMTIHGFGGTLSGWQPDGDGNHSGSHQTSLGGLLPACWRRRQARPTGTRTPAIPGYGQDQNPGCFDDLIYFLLVIHVTNLTNPINNIKIHYISILSHLLLCMAFLLGLRFANQDGPQLFVLYAFVLPSAVLVPLVLNPEPAKLGEDDGTGKSPELCLCTLW